ncbi:hypothetical protein DV738_g1580, partial [Chaetothyriales sp. CBS 135597]
MTDRRAKKACTECRQQKARCDARNFDDGICSRCRKMHLACIMSDSFEREHKRRKLSEVERENIRLRQQLESTKSATPSASDSLKATPQPCTSFAPTVSPEHGGGLAHVDAAIGHNQPPPPRCLGSVVLEAREVDELFHIYFRDFSSFFPILDPQLTPDACYASSPFLFWSIATVAARNHSLFRPYLRDLRPGVIDLALQSLSTEPCLNGATLHMAMQIGFHIPISSHEYSRAKLELTSDEIDKRAELWAYLIMAHQKVNIAKGFPSTTVQELTLDPDQRSNLIDQIPSDFKCQFRVLSTLARCGNDAARIGLRNMNDDRERALDTVLRLHERQLDNLACQLNPRDQLNLLMGRIILQGLHFLKRPSALAEDEMVLAKLCSNACQFIEALKLGIESSTFIPSALPFWYLYLTLISCSILMRILKTPLFCHKIVEEQRATSALHSGIDLLKSMALQENDLPSRAVIMMGQLWASRKVFHRQIPGSTEPEVVPVRVRTRIYMCHLLDMLAWWRDEFGRDELVRPRSVVSGIRGTPPPLDLTAKNLNGTTNGHQANNESTTVVSQGPEPRPVSNISTILAGPPAIDPSGSMQPQAISGIGDMPLDNICTFTPPSQGHATHRRLSLVDRAYDNLVVPLGENESNGDDTPESLTPAEAVHVSSSASFALLQFLKDIVSRNVGETDFAQVPGDSDNLTDDLSRDSAAPAELSLDPQVASLYTDAYMNSTTGIIFTRDRIEIQALLSSLLDCPAPLTPDNAIAYALVAIGAQASNLPRSAADEKHGFLQAQKVAFAAMLESQSLVTVELFLLLSFYMLAAGRRDTVLMYLGIAARAAIVTQLLPAGPNRGPDADDKLTSQRANVWRSLVTLDFVVSSLHGRPSATADHLPTLPQRHQYPDLPLDIGEEALAASYDLSLMISRIVKDIYGSRIIKTATANDYLGLLQQWLQRVPADLKLSVTPHIPQANTRQVIGSLHVSAYYYHVVMLVTRPFMIAHLIKKLAAHAPMQGGTPSALGGGFGGTFDSEITSLAHACTNAAIYLAQTAYEVHQSALLLSRMPLIEVWTFSAALVLGFRMFAAADQDWEIEDAYRNAQTVLETLAEKSRQANTYVDVLNRLYRAILKQRQLLTMRNREKSGAMVGKVMDIRQRSPDAVTAILNSSSPVANTIDNHHNNGTANVNLTNPENGWLHEFTFLEDPALLAADDSALPWENLSSQTWDPFSFDSNTLP